VREVIAGIREDEGDYRLSDTHFSIAWLASGRERLLAERAAQVKEIAELRRLMVAETQNTIHLFGEFTTLRSRLERALVDTGEMQLVIGQQDRDYKKFTARLEIAERDTARLDYYDSISHTMTTRLPVTARCLHAHADALDALRDAVKPNGCKERAACSGGTVQCGDGLDAVTCLCDIHAAKRDAAINHLLGTTESGGVDG